MNEIKIKSRLIESIKEHSKRDEPNEACGYLAGVEDSASEIYMMKNIDDSNEHFSFDPKEQFDVLKKARGNGVALIAVYHSHPESPARMSDEDIRLAFDPNMIYIIYSVSDDIIKAFGVNESKDVRNIKIIEV